MRRRWRRTGAFPPLQTWQGDGTDDLEVASRFGRLTLRRQVLEGTGTGQHVTPGNAVLPPHGGIVITRGLQEVACLLPDTLPFVSAERLLGWQTQAVLEEAAPTAPTGETAPAVLCASYATRGGAGARRGPGGGGAGGGGAPAGDVRA